MKSITVPAKEENLDIILDFIANELKQHNCSEKAMFQINLAVEELFVNIASYAYGDGEGEANVECDTSGDPTVVTIQFSDNGKPFDPLKKNDADISPDALEEREGGLGILMVKKSMDLVDYKYENGKNILTIKKSL